MKAEATTLKCLTVWGIEHAGVLETSEAIAKQEVRISGRGGRKSALKSKIILLSSTLCS